MQARVKAGWITEADLAPPPAEEAGRSRSDRGASVEEVDTHECSRRIDR